MRLLVACPKCRRQYDASGREIGSRFRCRCGEVLTIHQPEGHDAAVVRCSSCGAPRREGSMHCEYCNADFTVHEQQLDTICPHCFARVGDDAKFCDDCGARLAAEKLSELKTELICPACRGDRKLFSRTVDHLGIMECRICAGLWVENSIFEQLIVRARKSELFSPNELQNSFDRLRTAGATQVPHGYLPCPVCGELMLRKNYSHWSGVVIDFCKNHGLWFDGDKLSRLLHWIHSGGGADAGRPRLQEADRMARLLAAGIEKPPMAGSMLAIGENSHGGFWSELAAFVLELFTLPHL